jgi:hypothetical protein
MASDGDREGGSFHQLMPGCCRRRQRPCLCKGKRRKGGEVIKIADVIASSAKSFYPFSVYTGLRVSRKAGHEETDEQGATMARRGVI